MGSLYDQMLISMDIRDNKTNMTCQEQLFAIFDQVKLMTQRKDAVYMDLKKGAGAVWRGNHQLCGYG